MTTNMIAMNKKAVANQALRVGCLTEQLKEHQELLEKENKKLNTLRLNLTKSVTHQKVREEITLLNKSGYAGEVSVKDKVKDQYKAVVFENLVQKVLLQREYMGQFSDGYWENSPGSPWRDWCCMDHEQIHVAGPGEKPMLKGYFSKVNWNLNSKKLLDWIDGRMILLAKTAIAFPKKVEAVLASRACCVEDINLYLTEDEIRKVKAVNYTRKDLNKEAARMKKIFKGEI